MPITRAEFDQLLRTIESIVDSPELLVDVPHEDRVALLKAAGRLSRPTRDEKQRTGKAFRVVAKKAARKHDRDVRANTEIRVARSAEVFAAPPQIVSSDPSSKESELAQSRDCYVCKAEFRKVHFFYDALCPTCADFNYAKRFQTTSLEGRIALITGARIKIGFQAALMLLRAGAHVIVTTRFPRDAASRFARELDFASWRGRLEVHGLDLRHAPSVEVFARYLTQTKSRLDFLINNAAQTVRRPPGFYAHMLPLEETPFQNLSADVQSILAPHEQCKAALCGSWENSASLSIGENRELAGGQHGVGFVAWRGEGPGVGIRASAQLSQIPCEYDDPSNDAQSFPRGRADADLQQVDLRAMNSWRMTLSQVPSPEMLEVQLVNSVAPFILCSKLKELMMRDSSAGKHIVNVSAMEGQFARRTKTDKHPHTNMAKAALNMMTLTSAPDYAKDGIYMNAVDTGWVTDEDPILLSKRKTEVHDFQPPLDIVDGAARVCDPIFSGLISGEHVWGKFLKDYVSVAW